MKDIGVTILRLGHRPSRDKRITTHCGLVARAFGAKKIVTCGERDGGLVDRLNALEKKWGGGFKAEYCENWKRYLRGFQGIKVHLTMYGEDFAKTVKKILAAAKKAAAKTGVDSEISVLVVVGAGKVPPEAYRLCDYNVSVGNQPHSEVAAIALFLYELLEKKIPKNFKNASLKIVPTAKGKRITGKKRFFPS
jgi:tRNA (cytidine56-2'-O)-methyltransferase